MSRWIERGAVVLAVAVALCLAAPTGIFAQTHKASQTVSTKLKVKSVDVATRHLTVTDQANETFTLKVGDEVKNLDKVKAGDTISATYQIEVGLMLSKAGETLPKDADSQIIARAGKGELPAAAVRNHTTVTGTIAGIDQTNHTIKLIKNGQHDVHTIQITDAANQEAMKKLKVGDKLTASVTETLLIALN